MGPSREARLGIGLLLTLQLATSLGGVFLLGRMSPAVEQILTENVYSTEAVEDMLDVLVVGGDPARFERALARARSNITEEDEVAHVAALEALADRALAGEPEATARAAAALRELGAINRRSMQEADDDASRLGLAGAWAMALLGFLGFLASLGVSRRLERRVLQPVLEIDAVLEASRKGDPWRRCAFPDPGDGGRLADNLNWLLDRRAHAVTRRAEDPTLRDAVVALLDDRCAGAAGVLVDGAGRVVAVSQGALAEAVATAPLVEQVAQGAPPDGWRVRPLGHGLRVITRASGEA